MSKFKRYYIDSYHIQSWQQGYTLQVDIMRPANAPRFKVTKSDFKRKKIVSEINKDLSDFYFGSIEEISEHIDYLNGVERETKHNPHS